MTYENVRLSILSFISTPAALAILEGKTIDLFTSASEAEDGHSPKIIDLECLSPSSPSHIPSP